MSVDGSQSDAASAAGLLEPVRACGGIELAFKHTDGQTRLASLTETGGFRAKFPHTDGGMQAVLINTGGGMLGGDRYQFAVHAGTATDVSIVSQSAERVYRTLGPPTVSDVRLRADTTARLAWLPQPTILFDHARLQRRIEADVAADGSLLLVEAVVFGRAAYGERVLEGALSDQWRIRRDGRLVFAEAGRIAGPIDTLMQRSAIGAGARAAATLLYVARDADDRRTAVARAVDQTRGRAAVSAWNGLLTVRFLAHDAAALKADLVRTVVSLTGRSVPRVWQV
jgi:urease accessory protein